MEIENLQVWYEQKKEIQNVVNDISFHVAEGECIGLAGSSGCGKTQTMLALMGLLPSQALVSVTQAQWMGKPLPIMDTQAMHSYRGSQITMLFQNAQTALDPVMKIKTHFAECLRNHQHMKRQQAYTCALAYLERVHVPDPKRILESYPHQLSLGTCQRVMLAMTLCLDGSLWILDEPTSSLDCIAQAEILELLQELQKEEKKSMIFITHDLRLLPALCNRVYIMREGNIVEEIRGEELFSAQKHHPYTMQLLKDCMEYRGV